MTKDKTPPPFNPAPTRFIYNPLSSFLGTEGLGSRETIRHHAPDAIILINREFAVPTGCSDCHCSRSLKEDVMDISTSTGVASSPGGASFNIVTPRTAPTNYFDRGRFKLQPLMEVNIYFKGRFPIDSSNAIDDSFSLDNMNSPYPFYHVFWGVITSLNKSENAQGNEVVSVECSDILRFWEMTEVLTNPSAPDLEVVEGLEDVDTKGLHPLVDNTIFANQTTDEVIATLANKIFPQMFLGQGLTAQLARDVQKANLANLNRSIQEYWRERFTKIAQSLRIWGYNGELELVEVDRENKGTGDSASRTSKTFTITEKTNVEIQGDALTRRLKLVEQAKPYYQMQFRQPQIMQSERETMLSIAKRASETVNWEFFLDVTGELVFKPPFYNMDVRDYPVHVIEPAEIISEAHNTSESEVLTSMEVKGHLGYAIPEGQGDGYIYGKYHNISMSFQYGYRTSMVSKPFLNDSTDCFLFAQDLLAVHNANVLKTATLQIIGRPELRPGYPIYLPHRDMYYYVVNVEHSFAWGDSFTTNLTLRAGRSRMYSLPNDARGEFEEVPSFKKKPLKDMYLVRNLKDPFIDQQEAEQIGNREETLPENYQNSVITEDGAWAYKEGSEVRKQDPSYSPVLSSGKAVKDIIPISDDDGFELVGTLPYGRYLKVGADGSIYQKFSPMTLTSDLPLEVKPVSSLLNPKNEAAQELINSLQPSDPNLAKELGSVYAQRSSATGLHDASNIKLGIKADSQIDPDTAAQSLARLAPDSLGQSCNCDCHLETSEIDDYKRILKQSQSDANSEVLRNLEENSKRVSK
jgi:hypothetical protein